MVRDLQPELVADFVGLGATVAKSRKQLAVTADAIMAH
tara:strand:+ start:419 stop:532 length:114 start_codon:yes stop_codon:yes gene_type:complete